MPQAQEVYSARFDSVFFSLPLDVRGRIETKIGDMGARLDAYPHHRMKGSEDFRLRVGDYRIIYNFDTAHNIIDLIALGHRREIYRNR